MQASVDWDLDVWGRIRRTVESDAANAQASAADLAVARLSAQATLAIDYFELRAADENKRLYEATVDAYRRSLHRNQFAAGIVARSDVAAAETQLQQAQAQAIDLGVQRAALERAIALLVGKPPADLTITLAPLATDLPVEPTGVPSTLLQRRPDIADAERKMASANAEIGVAQAAFYPGLTLSAAVGFGTASLGNVFAAGAKRLVAAGRHSSCRTKQQSGAVPGRPTRSHHDRRLRPDALTIRRGKRNVLAGRRLAGCRLT